MGGKIPSFKIGEAKSIINQNRGSKIPSFKIEGQNLNSIKIGGVKLHLSHFFIIKQITAIFVCLLQKKS